MLMLNIFLKLITGNVLFQSDPYEGRGGSKFEELTMFLFPLEIIFKYMD